MSDQASTPELISINERHYIVILLTFFCGHFGHRSESISIKLKTKLLTTIRHSRHSLQFSQCPDTKGPRDECIVSKGEENCKDLIEAHKACLRLEGFSVK